MAAAVTARWPKLPAQASTQPCPHSGSRDPHIVDRDERLRPLFVMVQHAPAILLALRKLHVLQDLSTAPLPALVCGIWAKGTSFSKWGLPMRALHLVLVTLLVSNIPGVAQQALPDAPSVTGWHGVELLMPGKTVVVASKTGHATCIVDRADSQSLACAPATTYARPDVRSVRIHHRWRSALVGAGIGAGVGAVIGAATGDPACRPNTFCLAFVNKGELAGIFGIALGVVGLPVGYFTDFTRTTVYKAH